MSRILCAIILAIVWVSGAIAGTVHVPGDQPTIQAAIFAAQPGDTVLLADGVYSAEGNRDLIIDPYVTIMSQNGPESTIIDLGGSAAEFHRLWAAPQVGASWLDLIGLTVRNGYHMYGGAVHSAGNAIMIIKNCIFSDNYATWSGGALNGRFPSMELENCHFLQNSANVAGGAGYFEGAGLGATWAITAINCSFELNTAGGGGAISIQGARGVVMTGCSFLGNSAWGVGGAVHVQSWKDTLANCTFVANTAQRGSGLYHDVSDSIYVVNCTFSKNVAIDGGTIHVRRGLADTSSLVLENTIIALNECIDAVHCEDSGSAVTLSCCNFFSNTGGDWTGCIVDQAGVNGNFSLDPLFCDLEGNGFTLQYGSPCLPDGNSCAQLIGAFGQACSGICGDVNGDVAGPNVADLTFIVDFLFRGGPAPPNPAVADFDSDGNTTVADFTAVVDFLFKGGAPLVC